MAVTVSVYNHLTNLILSKAIDLTNLRYELLSNSATFDATHTTKEQVDNGSTATVTMTIASPIVVTHNAHGKSNGQPVAMTTTGALETGITATVFLYIVGATTNAYNLALTPGGAAINGSGSQSGVHTAHYGGSYETYGNGCPAGGPTLASVAVNSAAISDATVNDALITATNPSMTATGGSLPPTPSYKAVLYDATSFKPLLFVDFGQTQQAGITTDYKLLINAAGILNLVA
jgi:hypothetical protein